MDRRKHRRILFSRGVDVTLGDGQQCQLEAQDLSLAGIRLLSPQALKTGEQMKLKFQVMPRGKAQTLYLRGTVKYIERQQAGYALGIGFVDDL